MKTTTCLSLLLVVTLGFSGCVSTGSTIVPIQTDTPLALPTISSPKPTSTLAPTETSTATLPATLHPEQAKETIKTLLREPVDCEAPCFWGIRPGQTTLEEAIHIFTHLGVQLKHTNTRDNREFYGAIYDLGNGLEVSPVLSIQNNIVENLSVGITDTSQAGTPRKWSAYSPETLITKYGQPSRVVFALDWGPRSYFEMDMYFDGLDLIVQYAGHDIIPREQGASQVCPLIDQFESVYLWMGKDPVYPPGNAVPLEKETSMTVEEFSTLMTGNPDKACFTLKGVLSP